MSKFQQISRRTSLRLLGTGAAAGMGALAGGSSDASAGTPPEVIYAGRSGVVNQGRHSSPHELAAIFARNGIQFNSRGSGPDTSLTYRGERILLQPYVASEYSYKVEKLLELPSLGRYTDGNSAQGFTVFGEVGFVFYDKGFVRTIDLKAKTYIAEFALPAGAQNADNHAGQANFGAEFAEPGDEFPVLYLSSYLEKKCYVFRMTRTGATLVQTIYLTEGSRDASSSYTVMDAQAFFPDIENDKMIIKMGATDPAGAKYKYWKVFDMPRLGLGTEVYLFDQKRNDEFYVRTLQGDVPPEVNFVNAGFAMNGKIYILAGFSGKTSSLLVIDYEKRKILSEINWKSDLITSGEQEQCCRYGDSLLINFNGKDHIAQVTF